MKTKMMRALVKAAGEQDGLGAGQFTAYASVFGNVDSYGDVVEKGAFADSLAEWDGKDAPIPVYWSHQMGSDPMMNLGHVLTAAEDDHGLLVTAQLDVEGNDKAAYAYRLLKGRRVQQMSFAYDIIDAVERKADGEDPVEDVPTGLTLKKLRLHEVSIVPIGANQETEILEVKAAAVALATKAGRVISEKNMTSLRDARDALDVVIKAAEGGSDQDKASGSGHVKDQNAGSVKPQGEGAAGVTSEDAPVIPSVKTWATQLTVLEMMGASTWI